MTQLQNPKWLPLAEALEKMAEVIEPISDVETIAISEAKGRVAALDVASPINVPPFANSAMDGYAIRFADVEHREPLQVIGKSFAGEPFTGKVGPRQCVRIMTGAALPAGVDTVVMQENVSVEGDTIQLTGSVRFKEAVRPVGDDIKQHSTILVAGKKIAPIDIGLLASLGIAQVTVKRQLRVAIFSSGDELTLPGYPLKEGHIYDSNRFALIAMLEALDYDVMDLGIVPDEMDALRSAFAKADESADLVLCSGGVSVGDADYTKDVLAEMGQVEFWKLAIKPGKPLALGRLPNSIFIGLPGNPVSAVVTFIQVAQAALGMLSGELPKQDLALPAVAAERFRKRPGRLDFQRAYCWTDESGQLLVRPAGKQTSGVLSSFTHSNCFACLELERGPVDEGEKVNLLLFDHLLQ
ncbi:molybdopterin molybdotransferase MoeA [Alteromonas sp. ASW11-36]|uniref:Molybdopterin molybdenumtransferase n=1 Tax=Alteromonas arenosi TaxID=3055817 RepID=A0ABT7SY55_9ALTE|nr:molybdopterin molybdotransferase MoeA [Alteromonas sp. ASW11-36]MDM7860459.1 molybdopterin molybdotransferase MoeA [Alteromonas sp. ASW11-36]